MAVWATLLKQAPALLAAADALLARSRASSAASAASDDVQVLGQRLVGLEQQQQAQADLMKPLIEQITALTAAGQASARQARRAFLIGSAAAGLSIVAVLLALLR